MEDNGEHKYGEKNVRMTVWTEKPKRKKKHREDKKWKDK